jgi:hypothetical protein
MAVSKRLRYEILRRDNHACRYCGATAPDVKLNVDHVIPQALGGSNAPTNLVASCVDCNAGKTSSMPNATPVADVDQVAFRKAAARRVDMPVPTHDPETGMPTCWTFRDVELAMVEIAWYEAWRHADPEGPPFSSYEDFLDRRAELADRGVHIGTMIAAAVMAGSQRSTNLIWGVPTQDDSLPTSGEMFELGCDAVTAWETAWEEVANERPTTRACVLFCEEMTAAIHAGHQRETLLISARAAGRSQSFYLANHLPEIQVAGGGN